MTTMQGQHYLVIGAARSGISVARWLNAEHAQVTLTDQKSAVELSAEIDQLHTAGVSLKLGGHQAIDVTTFKLIVVSPGVPVDLPLLDTARRAGVPVIGEMELASRVFNRPIVAITGTKGKSTTTALIGSGLTLDARTVFVGGNLGKPFIEALSMPTCDEAVVEASSFQLETIDHFRPTVAVWLNLSRDHLDRHPSMAAYRDAKCKIFKNMTEQDLLILNADDDELNRFWQIRPRVAWFSLSRPLTEGAYAAKQRLQLNWNNRRVAIEMMDLQLFGQHNMQNALAAMVALAERGVPTETIWKAITAFPGLHHRLERVATVEGVNYYDDSKATNVESMVRAVLSFDRPVILIAGGIDKGGDFNYAAVRLIKRITALILIGRSADMIAEAFQGYQIERVQTLEAALTLARRLAVPGDTVLLSPGCASFDMFQNAEHRGDCFQTIVRSWIKPPGITVNG